MTIYRCWYEGDESAAAKHGVSGPALAAWKHVRSTWDAGTMGDDVDVVVCVRSRGMRSTKMFRVYGKFRGNLFRITSV